MVKYCFVMLLLSCLFFGCGEKGSDVADVIKQGEARIDSVLAELEQKGGLEEALRHYEDVTQNLERLDLPPNSPHYREQQRVLAYGFLRKGNMLRQLGRMDEAVAAGEREMESAQNSEDEIALARAYMNFGSTLLVVGRLSESFSHMEESRRLFEQGTSYDHKQGLGWYWILQADLALVGLKSAEPAEIVKFADNALELLLRIENWPGVVRAYSARAQAYEMLGDVAAAEADRAEAERYRAQAVPSE